MNGLDHPVIRLLFLLGVGFLLTSAYVQFGAYVNWPPFGTYPNFGSLPYISVYLVTTFIAGVLDWIRFRGYVRKDLVKQGVVQQ